MVTTIHKILVIMCTFYAFLVPLQPTCHQVRCSSRIRSAPLTRTEKQHTNDRDEQKLLQPWLMWLLHFTSDCSSLSCKCSFSTSLLQSVLMPFLGEESLDHLTHENLNTICHALYAFNHYKGNTLTTNSTTKRPNNYYQSSNSILDTSSGTPVNSHALRVSHRAAY